MTDNLKEAQAMLERTKNLSAADVATQTVVLAAITHALIAIAEQLSIRTFPDVNLSEIEELRQKLANAERQIRIMGEEHDRWFRIHTEEQKKIGVKPLSWHRGVFSETSKQILP